MARIYTRTGDDGYTGLADGTRMRKNSHRIEAIGTVDEVNAIVGIVRLYTTDNLIDSILNTVQNTLFDIGANLATAKVSLTREAVEWLEDRIDEFNAELPELSEFILPTGSPAACNMHMARAVIRRAERHVAAISTNGPVLAYLNRLSDLCFVLARYLNYRHEVKDIPWVSVGTLASNPEAETAVKQAVVTEEVLKSVIERRTKNEK